MKKKILKRKRPLPKETVECPKCGNPHCNKKANFCTNCGNQLNVFGEISPSLKYSVSEPQQSQ